MASLFLGFLIYIGASKTIDSPKEKLLKKENSELKAQYDLLNQRMDQAEDVLADIQRRDDDIYRTIFEAEPIAKEIREAGFGGVNRYRKLENFKNSDSSLSRSISTEDLEAGVYFVNVTSNGSTHSEKLVVNK